MANQKQHASRQVPPKALISAEAKKLATLSKKLLTPLMTPTAVWMVLHMFRWVVKSRDNVLWFSLPQLPYWMVLFMFRCVVKRYNNVLWFSLQQRMNLL